MLYSIEILLIYVYNVMTVCNILKGLYVTGILKHLTYGHNRIQSLYSLH